MTHDGAHWSRVVNVIKGWMMIAEMTRQAVHGRG
jgi:hypothetical protein